MLFANAHPSMSHVSPDFVPVFGDCLRMTRSASFHRHPYFTRADSEIQRSLIQQRRAAVLDRRFRYLGMGPSCSQSGRTWGERARLA